MRSIESELSTAQRAILFDNNNKNNDSECVADCDTDSDCDDDCDGGSDCDCDCDTPDQAVALDNVQSLWTNASAKAEHAICPLRLIEFLSICFDRECRPATSRYLPRRPHPHPPLEVSQRGPNVDGLKKAAEVITLLVSCLSFLPAAARVEKSAMLASQVD